MDKEKGRWKEVAYEDDWDYISKKFNLKDNEWDIARPSTLDYYKKDKISLNEFGGSHLNGGMSDDTIVFGLEDNVNNPAHYKQGSQEVIDIIEGAIAHAPEPVTAMLQAQVLKYLLRMWHKDKPAEDAKKAQWYLNRLVTQL
jgi:hypothetical protein